MRREAFNDFILVSREDNHCLELSVRLPSHNNDKLSKKKITKSIRLISVLSIKL